MGQPKDPRFGVKSAQQTDVFRDRFRALQAIVAQKTI
jgi:hypothetical protein